MQLKAVSQPDNFVRYANYKLLSLFIFLEIDCFHSEWIRNIFIAGINRRIDYYATD